MPGYIETVKDSILLFSRFEFALKDAGLLCNRNIAEPDWDSFANLIADSFDATFYSFGG